jgi:hypothetical protein
MNLLVLRLRRGSRAILLVGALALGAAVASCGSVANKSDGGPGSGGMTGGGGTDGLGGMTGASGAPGDAGTGGAPGDGSVDQASPDGGGTGAKWDVDKWDMAQWS